MNRRGIGQPILRREVPGPKFGTNVFKSTDMLRDDSNTVTRAALLQRIKEVQMAIELLKSGAVQNGSGQPTRKAASNMKSTPPRPTDLATSFVHRLEDTQATLMKILDQIRYSDSMSVPLNEPVRTPVPLKISPPAPAATIPRPRKQPLAPQEAHHSRPPNRREHVEQQWASSIDRKEELTVPSAKFSNKAEQELSKPNASVSEKIEAVEEVSANFAESQSRKSSIETPAEVDLCPPAKPTNGNKLQEPSIPSDSHLEEIKQSAALVDNAMSEHLPRNYKFTCTSPWSLPVAVNASPVAAVVHVATCAVQTEMENKAASPPPVVVVHSYTETDAHAQLGSNSLKDASINVSPIPTAAPLCERGCSARSTPRGISPPAPIPQNAATTPEGVPMSVEVSPECSEVLLRPESLLCCEWCGCKDATAHGQPQSIPGADKALPSEHGCCREHFSINTRLRSPTETPESAVSTGIACLSESEWDSSLKIPAWHSSSRTMMTLDRNLGTLDSLGSSTAVSSHPSLLFKGQPFNLVDSAASTPSTCTVDTSSQSAVGGGAERKEEFNALAVLKLRRLSQTIRSTRTTQE